MRESISLSNGRVISANNFGVNNYSGGMELLIFNPKDMLLIKNTLILSTYQNMPILILQRVILSGKQMVKSINLN